MTGYDQVRIGVIRYDCVSLATIVYDKVMIS